MAAQRGTDARFELGSFGGSGVSGGEQSPACLIRAPQTEAFRYLGEVKVGLDPEGMAADPRTGLVYVACSRSNAVSVIDPEGPELLGMVPVGLEPIAVAVDVRTNRVFTADARSDQVSVIDIASRSVISTVPVGEYPAGIGIDETRRRVYCGNTAGSTVSVIDAGSLKVVATVPAELGAGAIAVAPSSGLVYCANFVGSSLTVIDPRTLSPISRLGIREGACDVAFNQRAQEIYAVNCLASTVVRAKAEAGALRAVSEWRLPNAPVGARVAPEGDRIYVSNRGDGSVSVLGLDGQEWARVPVGCGPGGLCPHPGRPGLVLVSNAGSGTVSAFQDLMDEPPRRERKDTAPQHPLAGQKLAPFSLPDLDGRWRESAEWAGKPYIVNVFASW